MWKNNIKDLLATLLIICALVWLYLIGAKAAFFVLGLVWLARAVLLTLSYKMICEIYTHQVMHQQHKGHGITWDRLSAPTSLLVIEFLRAFFFPTWTMPHVVSLRYRLRMHPAWYSVVELPEDEIGKYPFRQFFCYHKDSNLVINIDENGYHEGTYEK